MKKRITLIIIILFAIFALGTKSYAGISISASSVNMNPGETKSITLNGSGVTGTVSAQSSNNNVATVSAGNWVENNSVNISITGKSEGTATITVSGKVADSTTGEESNYSKTISVTVTKVSSSTSNSNTGNTSNNNTGTSTSTSTNNTQTKSNNANLSNLGIRPNDFSGFKAGTTTYNVSVPNDVSSVELYATAQHSKAAVSGTGKKTLAEGKNALSVTVTAEDGKTTKTYTVNVTRLAKEEQSDDKEQENQEDDTNIEVEEKQPRDTENTEFGLENLEVEGLELKPEFQTDVYEYSLKLIGEAEQVNITANATDENAIVDITGNENLKEGENVITILVTDKNLEETATYQIIVNKSLIDEEAIAKENEEKEKKRNIIIISAIAIVLVIGIIIAVIVKHKKNKEYSEEYSIPYTNINNNEEEIEEEKDFKEKAGHKKGKRFKD